MIASTVVMDTIANIVFAYEVTRRKVESEPTLAGRAGSVEDWLRAVEDWKADAAESALEDIRALLELQDDSIREQLEELKL